MNQTKWFERKFAFDTKENIFPSIIERLCGTPVRLEEKLQKLPVDILKERYDGKWSIAEHIGHLSDLEPLWQDRLRDILKGKEVLRPADLENRKTNEARHNQRSIPDLLKTFREIRSETLALIEHLNEDDIFKFAFHPRLKTPMRTMDLFLFVAEHDDHHLASITEIARAAPRLPERKGT